MPLPPDFVTLPAQSTYVCSGHGVWAPHQGHFFVPENVTLLFWVHHGEALTHGAKLEDLLLKVKRTPSLTTATTVMCER
ncbi:MAG: hypothetical protein RLZZ618_2479 [Pseudomonadota bacterium]|jgi:hypothetical protein